MIKITDKDLLIIEDFSKDAFRDRHSFAGLSAKEIQIYCLVSGIERFLISKGVSPRYCVEGFVQENSDSIQEIEADDYIVKESKRKKIY